MIRVFPTPAALAEAAAEVFADETRAALREQGRCAVALAGGDTPRPAYRKLAELSLQGRADWDGLHLFWGDERCVPPDDERSNYRMVRETLLDRLGLPPGQVHPIRCAGGAEAGARDYEEELRAFFGGERPCFDLVLLGLGEDGHTASLFPGTAAATERSRWVAAVSVPGQSFARVTLTLPAINGARTIVFLVSGRRKAEALRRALEPQAGAASVPAQAVRPEEGRVLWLADAEAASLLGPRDSTRGGRP